MKIYKKNIKKRIPVSWQVFLTNTKEKILCFTRPIRTKKWVTKILGKQYKRSRQFIQLDITYDCTLKCLNCNRSCGQAQSNDHLTLEQIEKFIKESKENNIKWEVIDILGGEPTIHSQILEIINLLLKYKKEFSKKTLIQLYTNGHGEKVVEVLKKIPDNIHVINSAKDTSVHTFFQSFNVIATDNPKFKNIDYSNGCRVISVCGLGLTPYGYYPCAVAGGIDRVFGFNLGRKKMPQKDDLMLDLLERFCPLCGHFKSCRMKLGEKPSNVWVDAYRRYKDKQPILDKY